MALSHSLLENIIPFPVMSLGLRFICAFSVAIHCLSSLVLQTLSYPTFTESILFVLCLNGIFQRLAS